MLICRRAAASARHGFFATPFAATRLCSWPFFSFEPLALRRLPCQDTRQIRQNYFDIISLPPLMLMLMADAATCHSAIHTMLIRYTGAPAMMIEMLPRILMLIAAMPPELSLRRHAAAMPRRRHAYFYLLRAS